MLFEDYKNLHQIPEIGFKEFKTNAYIFNRINHTKAKIEMINTGICAFFEFNKKKTIAFRAELDALRIKENNDFAHISKHNGYMHACGHDGHMAILLSLIDYVNTLKDYPYNILFIFQPSEERIGGSLSIIPYLKKYNFEVIFGMHVFPSLQENTIYSNYDIIFASATEIDIKILTESIHIANYKKNQDSIFLGNSLIKKLENIAKKEELLLHFGMFNAGKLRNTTANKCIIKGSLRSFNDEKSMNFINKYLVNTKNIKYKVSKTIPVLKNTYSFKNKLLNDLNINLLKKPFFQAEDFSFYSNFFPTMFFLLGVNTDPLHTSLFHLNETNLKCGYDFYLKLIKLFSFK